jgi:hypothetical protein
MDVATVGIAAVDVEAASISMYHEPIMAVKQQRKEPPTGSGSA